MIWLLFDYMLIFESPTLAYASPGAGFEPAIDR